MCAWKPEFDYTVIYHLLLAVVLEQGLLLKLGFTLWVMLTGFRVPKLPFSTHLMLGLQEHTTTSGFFVGAGVPNWGSHASRESTLPTEPSLQPPDTASNWYIGQFIHILHYLFLCILLSSPHLLACSLYLLSHLQRISKLSIIVLKIYTYFSKHSKVHNQFLSKPVLKFFIPIIPFFT